MLEHGGRLTQAAKQYNIALKQWLDLSTGINPNGWPVPEIPASTWARLPEEDDGLEQIACNYYGAKQVLPVAGSQAAIQALPQLRKNRLCQNKRQQSSRVAVLSTTYAEHAFAWQTAGHQVIALTSTAVDNMLEKLDVLIIVNPNNPTGERFSIEQLLNWHQQLASRGGWLVVDEAFMDVTPQHSLVAYSQRDGLIVLRSLGKFFGLAGARVGFVCAQREITESLKNLLGPWSINTPARYLAAKALADRPWQQMARNTLTIAGRHLQVLLKQYDLDAKGECDLFQWVVTPQAQSLHENLAQQGILTRLFGASTNTLPSLRFGLPKTQTDWQRLQTALAQIDMPKATRTVTTLKNMAKNA